MVKTYSVGGEGSDTILGGQGDDLIDPGNGINLINSGTGFDITTLGNEGINNIILEVGEGFNTIENFRLKTTNLGVSNVNTLRFQDVSGGVEIFLGLSEDSEDQIAFLENITAATLVAQADAIFFTA